MVPFVNERRERASVKEIALIALFCIPIFVVAKSYYDSLFVFDMANPFISFVVKVIDPLNYFLIFTFVYFIYSTYLWKPIARVGLLDVPVIDGNWDGTVSASHVANPIPITMEIRQRLNKVQMESMSSGNFVSNAVLMAYDKDSAGKSRIKYLYRCIKNGKNDHYGTAVLTFLGERHAEGWYYTDSKSNKTGGYSPSGLISINKKN